MEEAGGVTVKAEVNEQQTLLLSCHKFDRSDVELEREGGGVNNCCIQLKGRWCTKEMEWGIRLQKGVRN